MKIGFLIIVMMMFVFCLSLPLFAGGHQDKEESLKEANVMPGVLTVELIYLDHGPVRKVITDIDNQLEGYGEEIQLIHYTFSSPEGKSFAELKKLHGHVPLAIYVNGTMEFISFPQGGGTGFVEDGAWKIDDLKQVIDEVLGQI